MHSPMTEFLKQITTGISALGVPVKFSLPGPEVPEPFVVIGPHFDNDDSTPKMGRAIVTTEMQMDLFYPIDADVAEFEDRVTQIKGAVQPVKAISVSTSEDNTIGRTTRRALFQITKIIQ